MWRYALYRVPILVLNILLVFSSPSSVFPHEPPTRLVRSRVGLASGLSRVLRAIRNVLHRSGSKTPNLFTASTWFPSSALHPSSAEVQRIIHYTFYSVLTLNVSVLEKRDTYKFKFLESKISISLWSVSRCCMNNGEFFFFKMLNQQRIAHTVPLNEPTGLKVTTIKSLNSSRHTQLVPGCWGKLTNQSGLGYFQEACRHGG